MKVDVLPLKSILHGKQFPNFSFTDFNALKRLKQLETSFQNKPRLAEEYKKFMTEYETLNHMAKLGEYPHATPKNDYCLHHRGVLKESSTTTKLRVVFDGRNKRPTQTSINEELTAGSALQNDLSVIISRWRKHKIALLQCLDTKTYCAFYALKNKCLHFINGNIWHYMCTLPGNKSTTTTG